ncbi:OmpA family protein, partial [Vibrio parahaemolyticus]
YLTKESYKQLDILVQLLSQNPGVHIKVMGHTDFTASDDYNQWLSDRRAKRVADYLISKGVPESNVTHIGFGKRNPVADNNTDEGRAKNRRV